MNSTRVFIRDARLSYPALDKPRETMAGNGELKYQATFLLEPNNPCVENIRKAIIEVASSAFGDKAQNILKKADNLPLKRGDDKDNIPDGYAGMLYVGARAKNRPELRDANPRIMITGEEEIRTKFVAGYKVNGYIDVYAYTVKAPTGAVIKQGIAAGLVSVQFAGYADAFSGAAATKPEDYPDCTSDVANTQSYDAEPDIPF